ncbi:RNA polymerase sigma factor [Christiangramia salexigens]|uniref:RNA polymerase sigma-70 factor n=1 Tax=Christiangramia salexigens TaxID=1913577 RepID=A0A1L3J476_9FLAO|nr:RNA polymerase sigma-70 factor [Christiangramia salexigens]APG59916.1 hypothetical protein LPB144_05590 [Christiangramia salexigens]
MRLKKKGIERKEHLKDFEELYEKNYEALCAYVLKLSGNPALSKDIVQETFIGIWEKREDLRIKTSFKAYLYKACYHRFIEKMRASKKEADLLDTLKWETIYSIHSEGEMNKKRKLRIIKRAVDQLSPKCREAFLLSRYNGLKYAEIAETMNISVKTVELHISKALSRLRKSQLLLYW